MTMVKYMKKFIIFLLIIITCCGCNSKETVSRTDVIINMPTDNSVNGYRNEIVVNSSNNTTTKVEDKNQTETTVIQYCANINSKKFHLPDCGSVETIKQENRLYLSDKNELISLGYEPCKKCNP